MYRLGGKACAARLDELGDAGGHHGVVRLVQMTMNKREKATFYLMEFTDGRECWGVARRYSEFRELHKKLAGLFGKEYEALFQNLPPKESVGVKLCSALGPRSTRLEWKAGRRLSLQQYVVDLMKHPGTSASGIVHNFVRQGGIGNGTFDAGSFQSGFGEDPFLLHNSGIASMSPRSPFADEGESPLPEVEFMVLAGVRARRVPDEPGTFEVTVHTYGEPTGRRIQILQRSLEGVDGDEGLTNPGDFVRACEDLELQAAEGGMSEVAQQLALPPSTTWEIAAREVNSAGMMGTATSLILSGCPAGSPIQTPRGLSVHAPPVVEGLPPGSAPISPSPADSVSHPSEAPGEADSRG